MPDRTPNPSAERFEDIGRLPESSDNVAIASRKLSAGTPVRFGSGAFEISADILEGHRFAIRRIEKGETLLSWGLPFGRALREIEPGEYICNARILKVLAARHVEFRLPDKANFEDYRLPFKLEENPFRADLQRRLQAGPQSRGWTVEELRGGPCANSGTADAILQSFPLRIERHPPCLTLEPPHVGCYVAPTFAHGAPLWRWF